METRSNLKPFLILFGVSILFCLSAPHLLSEYGLHIAIISLFYVLMTAGWNIVAGFTGQVSFAQAAFASMGAYSSGILMNHSGLPIYICVPFAAGIAALFGWGLGKLCLPLGGKYLSLVTLSFSEILRIILTNEDQWTRGTQDLQVPGIFSEYSKIHMLWVFTAVTAMILFGIRILIRSNLGLLFRSVMSDEVAAASLGVRTTQVRVLAFTLSSAISGIAGALYGHYLGLVTPDLGSLDQMFLILAMTIVGGKGTWLGPLVGAVLLEVLSERIRVYGEYYILIFGIMTLIMIRFAPQGLLGKRSNS